MEQRKNKFAVNRREFSVLRVGITPPQFSLTTAVTSQGHLQEPQPTSYPTAHQLPHSPPSGLSAIRWAPRRRHLQQPTRDPRALPVSAILGRGRVEDKGEALSWAVCVPVLLIQGTGIPALSAQMPAAGRTVNMLIWPSEWALSDPNLWGGKKTPTSSNIDINRA